MKKTLLILAGIFVFSGCTALPENMKKDLEKMNQVTENTDHSENNKRENKREREGESESEKNMTGMMENMPCHQMGGKWMGKCERDANGNVIENSENDMNRMNNSIMGSEKKEIFSLTDAEISEFPKVEPTKLVKLKDGDTFEMMAEMVQQEVGNRTIKRLAYNRQIPGPIIEVEKNAKIKIKLTNKLDVNTTLHSHGLRLDDDSFDGVPDTMGGAQPEMKPGESFTYELNFPDSGVFWYHPHIREDYTQEMGLYGNYHVTEEGYWNPVDREEFLVLDDFSENDPFYKDLANKTLMGRFGNILLINNQENFQMKAKTGEKIRFYITNTANTRTFDIRISYEGKEYSSIIEREQYMKLVDTRVVGGDIGRIEKEYSVNEISAPPLIIAPAERYIIEVNFDRSGKYEIQHRGKKFGEIIVSGEKISKNAPQNILRKNPEDYAVIRDDFQKFLDQKIDKKLRISIGMKRMGKMRMGMNHKDGMGNMKGGDMGDMMKKEESFGGKIAHDESDGIEWEDGMAQMNTMSNSEMMEWMLIDETDPKNPKTNMDIDWKLPKNQFIKIEIFNDPNSMHPMQHPIHFHGQQFVVLTRDGVPNDNLQWKDTTLVRNGEKIEILLNTTNPGKWMTHCHIAEHLHAGMMFNFEVENKDEKNTENRAQEIRTLGLSEFKNRKNTGEYTLVDLRTPEEWATGVIDKEALFINFYNKDFQKNLNTLNKDKKYLLYCRSGNRSGKTLKIMKTLGFKYANDLSGGIPVWDEKLEMK